MIRLTPREQQVYDALDVVFDRPDVIARRVGITTRSPRETASKFCIRLVRLGLAERAGQKQFPQWRRLPFPQSQETE
jgi:hypothetical protein